VLSASANVFTSAVAGLATGLQFNPLSAAVSAVVAAALTGYRRAPRSRIWWAAAVLLVGWAAGDGIRVAGSSAKAPFLAAWAIAGLASGYVLPAVAGSYIGRQVHRGTGWLSAGAVALMVVPALSTVAGTLSGALLRAVA
jgi:hypothetical protein